MAFKTILALGAPWPGAEEEKTPQKRVNKINAVKTYLQLHPGSYTIELARQLKLDYGSISRTLQRMTQARHLKCVDKAYYVIEGVK